MVTLDDVAARAGVSRMTASNAMRGKPIVRPATAERVRRAADELGYHPSLAARQLSSGKTGVIGLSVADLDMVFPAELTAEISDEAYRRGYQLIAQQTRLSPDYERAMLGNASAQICDGTIMCWPSEQAESIAEYGRTHPLVLLDGFGFEGRVDCVFTPFLAGAKSAAEHLIEQPAPAAGHRMLILGAVYRSPEELLHASDSPSLRLRGAYEALRDHGLPYDPANVVLSGWTRESGYETMSRILDERRDFDLVFCLTDMIAIGALKALLDHGVGVPGMWPSWASTACGTAGIPAPGCPAWTSTSRRSHRRVSICLSSASTRCRADRLRKRSTGPDRPPISRPAPARWITVWCSGAARNGVAADG